MAEYTYTKEPVAVDKLTKEIKDSAIVTALDYINLLGTDLSVFFKADLSEGDETLLDAIVDGHDGVPLEPVVPAQEVVTQYEKNDKTLKLARGKATVDETGQAVIYCRVPGDFGSADGRYVAGGYGIAEDYNKDDYVIVRIEDKDRIIAWMVAQAIDPDATEPVADEMIQGMGVIDAIGFALPDYPMVRSYTDESVDEEQKGWYFWPNAQGNDLPPVGEVEVNPIGGYGFIPSGFYIKLIYQRPEGVTTGTLRVNIDWGRME